LQRQQSHCKNGERVRRSLQGDSTLGRAANLSLHLPALVCLLSGLGLCWPAGLLAGWQQLRDSPKRPPGGQNNGGEDARIDMDRAVGDMEPPMPLPLPLPLPLQVSGQKVEANERFYFNWATR